MGEVAEAVEGCVDRGKLKCRTNRGAGRGCKWRCRDGCRCRSLRDIDVLRGGDAGVDQATLDDRRARGDEGLIVRDRWRDVGGPDDQLIIVMSKIVCRGIDIELEFDLRQAQWRVDKEADGHVIVGLKRQSCGDRREIDRERLGNLTGAGGDLPGEGVVGDVLSGGMGVGEINP